MKNLILTIAAVISLANVAVASNIGDGSLAIIKSESVEITLENESQKSFIVSSVYEAENQNISMEFDANVNMIQVYSEGGDLEMMFPIDSKEVNLGMSLFEKGNYQIAFTVEGLSEVQFTSLQIK